MRETTGEGSFQLPQDTPPEQRDGRGGGPHPFGRLLLPQPVGDVERLAHGAPDDLRVFTVGERLVHGAVTEAGQHEIFRHAFRVGLAELLAHPCPELRQPHRPRLPALQRGTPTHRRFSGSLGDNRDIYRWYVVVYYGELCCVRGACGQLSGTAVQERD